jgi:FKBP-type peptidyl-prolyl cis-trans isomerase
MRRTLAVIASASIVIAACGADDGDSTSADDTQAPAETELAADGADTDTTDGAATDAGETADTAGDGTTAADDIPPPTSPDKPDVAIPDEIPEELQISVLAEGTGAAAVEGDTVIVDYIGVRSSDGVEFDNSYDRFEPIPVSLGAGSVIKGWEDGLVGAQTGAQLQLDIPSDLAYGTEARGDVIGENEALTFVIDVRAVIPQTDPADQPTEAGVPASEGATEVTTVDLVDGEGATLEEGDTAVLELVLFRGDNLVTLDTTWESEPIQIPMNEQGFPGLVEGMPGMKVGGRRAIVIPPEFGFGPEGSPEIGLPAETDAIVVVDLLGKY